MVDEIAIDGLYGLPLEEFTAARDELAKKLRASGDREGASEVKKLRKPSLAAWAVNQLVHDDSESIERLLELRKRIERSSDAGEMRGASEERRRLIGELVVRARSLLEGSGHAASADTIQAITQTLHAGVDDGGFRRGTLTHDLQVEGFGFGGSADEMQWVREDPRSQQKRERAEALEGAARRAEAEADQADRDLAEAEREWRRSRALAENARRAAEQARARATRAWDETTESG